jgi:hypothetical protein
VSADAGVKEKASIEAPAIAPTEKIAGILLDIVFSTVRYPRLYLHTS